MSGRGRIAAALAALALAIGCGKGHPQPEELHRDLTLTLADGARLPATVYPGLHPNPPGLLLLQDSGLSRDRWSAFATRTQSEGFAALAVDLPADAPDRATPLRGAKAALAQLVREGADPANLAIVGAGAGAELALECAATGRTPVRALVLISPGGDLPDERLDALVEAFGPGEIFFLYTSGDTFGAQRARRLKDRSTGFTELREYAGTARGTDIFVESDNALEQVLNWLDIVFDPTPGLTGPD